MAQVNAAALLGDAILDIESLLPEGWSFWEISGNNVIPGIPAEERIYARARLANVIYTDGTTPEISASGPTVLAVVADLVTQLRALPR